MLNLALPLAFLLACWFISCRISAAALAKSAPPPSRAAPSALARRGGGGGGGFDLPYLGPSALVVLFILFPPPGGPAE